MHAVYRNPATRYLRIAMLARYTACVLIGLIADTHGFIGDDALAAFATCDHILHAGDVGDGVLAPLAAVAPLTAVRGNNDLAGEAAALPEVAFVDLAGHRIALVHRLIDAPADGFDLLVFGHCHRQHDYTAGAACFVNPGAAGRRGFHATRSVALLELRPGAEPAVRFIDLGARGRRLPQRAVAV
jgi:putative phosphoesterase